MRTGKLAALAVPSLLLTQGAAWAQQGEPYFREHMWGVGWHNWFVGPMMMIFFIAIAVLVVILVVRWIGGASHGPATQASAGDRSLDILKERFARGEIDKDEFEDRRRVLTS